MKKFLFILKNNPNNLIPQHSNFSRPKISILLLITLLPHKGHLSQCFSSFLTVFRRAEICPILSTERLDNDKSINERVLKKERGEKSRWKDKDRTCIAWQTERRNFVMRKVILRQSQLYRIVFHSNLTQLLLIFVLLSSFLSLLWISILISKEFASIADITFSLKFVRS